MGRTKTKEWNLDNAHELAEAGLSIAQIAEILGEDWSVVQKTARKKNWKFRYVRGGPGRQVTWDVETARKLRDEGKTWTEIAQAVDADASSVRSFFVRRGLHEPKSKPQLTWDVEKAKDLWNKGLKNWAEIGRRVGTSGQNVRRAFVRWGLVKTKDSDVT